MRHTAHACVKLIKQALVNTHQVKQVRAHYHYRGPEINDPRLLATNLTIRKGLSPVGRYLEQQDGRTLLDTLLYGLYNLGRQQGRKEMEQELAHLRQIADDIARSQSVYDYRQ